MSTNCRRRVSSAVKHGGCTLLVFLTLLLPHAAFARDETWTAGGSRLQIHWQAEFSVDERAKIKQWLQHAAECAATLYGELPRDSIRILIERSDDADEPVVYGRVLRQHPQGIQFWINPDFSLQAFLQDWTAVHEFVHLYIPFPGNADIWLSEGLATYYQNILRARTGVLSHEQAWQKLYNGFMRGKADNRYSALSLTELSPRLRETNSFMRIYWTGTAYFMEADIQLRQKTANQMSLDTVIRDYVDCCLARGLSHGLELAQSFDRLSDSQIFSTRYQRYRGLYQQPDTLPLFSQLGISVSDETIHLEPMPEDAIAIREAIVSGHTVTDPLSLTSEADVDRSDCSEPDPVQQLAEKPAVC